MTTKTHNVALGFKRAFDVTGAATLLVALSPVIAFTALAVKAQRLGGPVIFRQQRYGRNQQPFTIYKFRTMHNNPQVDMAQRLTPTTRWLRKFSLDELPQLFNVLTGDMSLIGPRPTEKLRPHAEIYAMRPGMTGLAQIMGRNAVAPAERAELDRTYVQHWSLARDLRILGSTVPVWLRAKGYCEPDSAAYQANLKQQAAMAEGAKVTEVKVREINGVKLD